MLTRRDVIDYVEKNRGIGTKKLYITRRAFHRVRERLMKIGVARSAVRPDAALAQFFPENVRRSLWVQARGDISIWQWPDLVRPGWLQSAINVAAMLVVFVVLIARMIHIPGFHLLSDLAVAGASAGLTVLLLLWLTRRCCGCFPGLSTVRDLTICAARGGPKNLDREPGEFARAEIAATVKAIVIEQLGISETQYAEDKDFIRDLGME